MTSSLITCHILCLHNRRSCKCQLDTFPQNSSLDHHRDITRNGIFIIHAAYIIGITKTNQLKSTGTPICQHEILGTLKIPQNFLSHFLVALTRITQIPTQQADNKINIRACAYLRIHQAFISLNIIMRILAFEKFVTLFNWCLTRIS